MCLLWDEQDYEAVFWVHANVTMPTGVFFNPLSPNFGKPMKKKLHPTIFTTTKAYVPLPVYFNSL